MGFAVHRLQGDQHAWGGDLLQEVIRAFRSRGLKVGFYYSLIDWHHPDFTIDRIHALRNHTDRAGLIQGRDMSRYREYMKNQVRELLTNFGKIDIIWYDFSIRARMAKGATTGTAPAWKR